MPTTTVIAECAVAHIRDLAPMQKMPDKAYGFSGMTERCDPKAIPLRTIPL